MKKKYQKNETICGLVHLQEQDCCYIVIQP